MVMLFIMLRVLKYLHIQSSFKKERKFIKLKFFIRENDNILIIEEGKIVKLTKLMIRNFKGIKELSLDIEKM